MQGGKSKNSRKLAGIEESVKTLEEYGNYQGLNVSISAKNKIAAAGLLMQGVKQKSEGFLNSVKGKVLDGIGVQETFGDEMF